MMKQPLRLAGRVSAGRRRTVFHDEIYSYIRFMWADYFDCSGRIRERSDISSRISVYQRVNKRFAGIEPITRVPIRIKLIEVDRKVNLDYVDDDNNVLLLLVCLCNI